MIFYIIFFILLCAVLLWVTICRKEAFPFSWYPMYSGSYSMNNIKVFRIALQQQDGKTTWWKSTFYRYPEYTGRKLYQLYNTGKENGTNAFFLLQRNKLLLDVLRIIESERKTATTYKAFHIIERSINADKNIVDRTIEIISFNELKNGTIS